MLSDSYVENPVLTGLVAAFSRSLLLLPGRSESRSFRHLQEVLREEVRGHAASKASRPDGLPPSYQEWRDITDRIGERILAEDVGSFLRWHDIVSTMGVENALFLTSEYRQLTRRTEWPSTIAQAILPPAVGRPLPFFLNRNTTGNFVHHAFTAFEFFNRTHANIWDADTIVEFGGGYGNMALLMHRLGFKGKYYIYDFPVLSSLQKFYLNANDIHASLGYDQHARVCCIHDMNEWVDTLRSVLTSSPDRQSCIATWSLSEAPEETRAMMEPFMPAFGKVMMGYQDVFGEVDNRVYLMKLKAALPMLGWHDYPVQGLPRHHFLFGCAG